MDYTASGRIIFSCHGRRAGGGPGQREVGVFLLWEPACSLQAGMVASHPARFMARGGLKSFKVKSAWIWSRNN